MSLIVILYILVRAPAAARTKYGGYPFPHRITTRKLTSQVYLKDADGIVAAKPKAGKAASPDRSFFKNNINVRFSGF
jgi:hypothetical protein